MQSTKDQLKDIHKLLEMLVVKVDKLSDSVVSTSKDQNSRITDLEERVRDLEQPLHAAE